MTALTFAHRPYDPVLSIQRSAEPMEPGGERNAIEVPKVDDVPVST
jgi:hypothetical protein